mmetsp:Transcript_2295/g.3806  ORF Transcript_2295/g.3806 Transcript_2295/m.3806 type:complete len:276 (-) Transcript_2295:25-852(-)
MNELMLTLYRIQKETGVAKLNKEKSKTEQMNPFERQRTKVAEQIRTIRKTIKERDELLESTAGNKASVELSNNVRHQLKTVREDAEQLAQIQKERARKVKKKSKKTGLSDEEKDYLELQEEIVELSFKHIEECERLEKRVHYSDSMLDDSSDQSDGVVTSLPDVDDDGALGQRFAMLKQRDAEIDRGLEQVGEGVQVLKEMALEMSDAADVTNLMMDEVDTRVEQNMAQTQNLNKRLKSTLESVRSGNRFMLDFICCCVILGVAGVLYKTISAFL